jgi:hypothetical protein
VGLVLVLVSRMFEEGAIRVLCCTATLAWGINLPAHTVVIKGTEVYNPDKGGFSDLSMLDVMQVKFKDRKKKKGGCGERPAQVHDRWTPLSNVDLKEEEFMMMSPLWWCL